MSRTHYSTLLYSFDTLDGSMEISRGWDMFNVGGIFDEGSGSSFCHFGCI
jgi:hypothetical protein